MFGKRLILGSKLLLLALLASCTTPAPRSSAPDLDLLYQTATLSALSAGDFAGEMSLVALREHGDFGLGTFNDLDGEMVVLDGQIYQVRDDGIARIASDGTQTPFAVVTFFEADQAIAINEAVDCVQLQARIDSQLPTLNAPYAIKVSDEFTSLKVRTPHKESAPYPPTLAEALTDQVIWDSQNISGTMVGFRLPEYMAGANSAGYHFHFISYDKQHGGHVLECQADTLTVQVDQTDRIHIDVTPPTTEPQVAPIKVGMVLPFSGQYEWLGNGSANGIRMVNDDVNNNGGINGALIELHYTDTEGAVDTGAAAAQTLIDEGVVALLGPTSLSFSGVMPLIIEHKIPMISPSAGTIEMDRAGSDFFYRTVPSDSLGGRALAHAVTDSAQFLGEPLENVVLMMSQASAFLSFQEPIESGFASAGKQLAAVVALPQGAASYAAEAEEALSHAPDLIILVGDPTDSVKVMQEASVAGYTGRWFFTQDQTTVDYIELATPERIEGSYGIMEIAEPASIGQATIVNELYTAITNEAPPPFFSNAYDAATVVFLAILRASIHDWEVTGETVNANIPLVANPGEGKTVVTNYLQGKAVLMLGGEVNYQGINGSIDFDDFGNITQSYGIFQVQNGVWNQIATVDNDLLQTLLGAE